jgi:hypothetical protein
VIQTAPTRDPAFGDIVGMPGWMAKLYMTIQDQAAGIRPHLVAELWMTSALVTEGRKKDPRLTRYWIDGDDDALVCLPANTSGNQYDTYYWFIGERMGELPYECFVKVRDFGRWPPEQIDAVTRALGAHRSRRLATRRRADLRRHEEQRAQL